MSLDATLLNTLMRPPGFPASGKMRRDAFLPESAYRSSNLTKAQKSSLASLSNYVQANVKGDDAIKLARNLASLQLVMEMTNSLAPKRSSAYDLTTYNLFGGSSRNALPGLFYNRLL